MVLNLCAVTEMYREGDHIWAIVDDDDKEFYVDKILLLVDADYVKCLQAYIKNEM